MSALTPRLNSLEKNYIINSAMDFFQRSVSSVNLSTSFAYLNADRFRLRYTGTVTGTPTATRETDVPTNSLAFYSLGLSLQRNASASTLEVSQRIESIFSRDLAGNKVSLSFKVKSPIANQIRVVFKLPTAMDNWSSSSNMLSQTIDITPSSSWQTLTLEDQLVALSAKNGLELEISFLSPSGTDVSAQKHFITEICLTKSLSSQDFALAGRNWQEELQLCQRYFVSGTYRYANGSSGQQLLQSRIHFPVIMRVAPSVSRDYGAFSNDYIANNFVSWRGSTILSNTDSTGNFTADAEL